MLYLCIFIVLVVISIVLRIAAATGLALPVAYGLIAPTLFSEWFHANQQLAEGVGWAFIALTTLLWLISFAGKIAGLLRQRREDKAAEAVFLYRLRQAKVQGTNAVSTENLWR